MEGYSESEDPPGVRPLKLSKDPSPRGPVHSGAQGPPGGPPVCVPCFPVDCCGPVVTVVGYFDNGIAEGKGVWNEAWVSFRFSALISANKHTPQ